MTIVVDADVLVVLVSGDPRQEAAQGHLREWIAADEDIHAPALLPYEVANSLTRVIASGLLPSDRAAAAWQSTLSLPISYHPLHAGGDRVIETALRLQRHTAYEPNRKSGGPRRGRVGEQRDASTRKSIDMKYAHPEGTAPERRTRSRV
ncbi:MAG TPA: type II toxin-antitoxin system VapC family toxin [Chloroflexota bacterium]|nr:type II toxin-antitoxin system VapC family toxin [Chloroflexota bacterium]